MPDSLFLQETLSTPQALADTLDKVAGQARSAAAALLASGARRLVVLGSGSSLCASVASVYLYDGLAGPDGPFVYARPTGDHALYPAPLGSADALVGVSASGEILDLLDLFERMRGHHRLVGVTNEAQSSLATLVDHLLLTRAGAAVVPTSTKTFVTTVAALDLLWLELLQARGAGEALGLRQALAGSPATASRALALARDNVAAVAERLARCHRLYVLGAGPAYGVALEAALVLQEVAGVPATAVQTREMAQGVIAVVDGNVGVVAVCPPGPGAAAARGILGQLAARGATTIELGPESPALPFDPGCPDLLTPIVYCLPLFMLANELAGHFGIDTDHPAWEQDYLRGVRRPPAAFTGSPR